MKVTSSKFDVKENKYY